MEEIKKLIEIEENLKTLFYKTEVVMEDKDKPNEIDLKLYCNNVTCFEIEYLSEFCKKHFLKYVFYAYNNCIIILIYSLKGKI
jgi:hypothetical protein